MRIKLRRPRVGA